MQFKVVPFQRGYIPEVGEQSIGVLVEDNWDDWAQFATYYTLWYVDEQGKAHGVGGLKIGQTGMGAGHSSSESDEPGRLRRPKLPSTFMSLAELSQTKSELYFSLGQHSQYYEALQKLDDNVRLTILLSLQDIAFDSGLFDLVANEQVTKVSLLRSLTAETVQTEFHRLAHKLNPLVEFEFRYVFSRDSAEPAPLEIPFLVKTKSTPSTNIHALIGRNGVGKTRLLQYMARAALAQALGVDWQEDVGNFRYGAEEYKITKLISISFSAFDPFEPLSGREFYSYIGLKRPPESKIQGLKNLDELAHNFADAMFMCAISPPKGRAWEGAVEILTDADPILRELKLDDLVFFIETLSIDTEELAKQAEEKIKKTSINFFGKLSSGHKIVLLTIALIIQEIAPRTLILFDEPESHLHPPLLSALIDVLSDVLRVEKGVAILATHSPVVLQEIPRRCVWKITRAGDAKTIANPAIETFGENTGVLTNDVFRMDDCKVGFQRLLEKTVRQNLRQLHQVDFDNIIDGLESQLGSEGRAYLRALIYEYRSDNIR